jgi:hypothetical protein
MDAAKKAAFEKRLVMGLAGVFLVTFVMGPLRSMGLFRRRAAPAGRASVEPVTVGQSVGVMMEERWQQLTPAVEVQRSAQPPSLPEQPPAYTAQDLRDPLKNLFPDAPKAQAAGVAPDGSSPPPPPPPSLQVQGLLWGGREPKAVINDQVYGVNDVVDGATILEINRHGVTTDYRGTTVFYAPSSVSQSGSSR